MNLKSERTSAIRFLHDLGLILHFEHIDQELSEYFVLDPYWITYGVYQIVTSKYAGEQKGEVPMDKLEFIINEEEDKKKTYKPSDFRKVTYTQNERRFLVEILHQFRLCFYLPDRSHFILPDLLDTNEPKEYTIPLRESKDRIDFIYDYEYLHKSIIPFFLVDSNRIIKHRWRTGCIISKSNCEALISSYDNQLLITVCGQNKQKRELMSVIRYLVDSINKKLNLNPNKLVPLPEGFGNADYDELLEMEVDDQEYYKIYKPVKKEFEISKLLEGLSHESKLALVVKNIESLISEGFKDSKENQSAILKGVGGLHIKLDSISLQIQEAQSLISSNQDILGILNTQLVNEKKLSEHLNKLSTTLENIINDNSLLQENSRIKDFQNQLKTSPDIKGKFKITWSLLPSVLTEIAPIPNIKYEKEIAFNIKDIAKEIISDFRDGHIFYKPED